MTRNTPLSPAPPAPHPGRLPGGVVLAGWGPLVDRRRALADPGAAPALRRAAAHWLRRHGAAADRAAAQEFLTAADGDLLAPISPALDRRAAG